MSFYATLQQIGQSAGILALTVAASAVVERIIPAERSQPLRWTLMNFYITACYVVLTPLIMMAWWPLVAKVYHAAGGPLIRVTFRDGPAGAVLSQIVYLFVYDFFYYWFHRLQHTWPLLWRQHALHHSTPSLNASAAAAHHWLEEPMRAVAITLPMGVLFNVDARDAGIFGAIVGLHAVFIHWNARLDLGRLTPVIAGPQYHRIHHSMRPEHTDKNFAAYFPFWDYLFGTYWRPRPDEYPPTGLLSGETPRGLIDPHLWPFTRRS